MAAAYFDALTIILSASLALGIWRYRKASRLAPGPPAGLFGNFHNIPRNTRSCVAFKEFGDQYGPIICLWQFHFEIVVLNNYATASALLDHRSIIYSNRPTSWMISHLAERRDNVFLMKSTNPRFRIYRTLLHKTLNPRAIEAYKSLQVSECNTLLEGLLKTPDNFIAHLRRNAAAIIMSVAYGYQVQSDDDKFVNLLEESMRLLGTLSAPGRYWVELMPFLRHVPAWFPGAGFKRLAQSVAQKTKHFETMPFNWATAQMATGSHSDSFLSDHINDKNFAPTDEEREDILRHCATGLYVGGGDTSVSLMTTFFYLMACHPSIQQRARDEIDSVLDGELATHEHHSSLPYVNALIKELLRWGPPVPTGIAHQVTQDDYFDGYFIPEGTRIVANIWAMSRDENIYPNPDTFDPTRFIGENQQLDPIKFVFGFGRRVCPGIHLAEASLFLNVTNILGNFVISKKRGADGQEIEPQVEWVSGLTTHMKPFPCQTTPRSPETLRSLLVDGLGSKVRE